MPYLSIVKHYEECYRTYGDNYKGVDWPNEADAIVRYQIMLDIIKYDSCFDKSCSPSILDFGCGLGHIYKYIKKAGIDVLYTGLDISTLFINRCREKFPQAKFIKMDLLNNCESNLGQTYDYIVMNGVFTEKQSLSYEEMFEYFKRLIRNAYNICKYGMAFNVMSKDVDWERDDLFHLPLNILSEFLTKEITRNFIVRNDYGLYEYTVYIFKRGKGMPTNI